MFTSNDEGELLVLGFAITFQTILLMLGFSFVDVLT